jgi:hypothetical protein
VSPGCFSDPDRDAVKQGSKDSAREANQRDDSNRFRRTWGARKTKVINAPKGNRERRVDVSQQLAEALTKHRDQQQIDGLLAGRELGPWVFPGPNGQPVLPNVFWLTWVRVLKATGVPHRKPPPGPHARRVRARRRPFRDPPGSARPAHVTPLSGGRLGSGEGANGDRQSGSLPPARLKLLRQNERVAF